MRLDKHYRCAVSGCVECCVVFDTEDNPIGILVDNDWLCTATSIAGVVLSLFFCPKHYKEGMAVNNA